MDAQKFAGDSHGPRRALLLRLFRVLHSVEFLRSRHRLVRGVRIAKNSVRVAGIGIRGDCGISFSLRGSRARCTQQPFELSYLRYVVGVNYTVKPTITAVRPNGRVRRAG